MTATIRDYRPLRLAVADTDDLTALSAVMQDAVMKVGDFAFDAEARRFAFVANRFVWECAADRRRGPFARVRAGVSFDDVRSVQARNLRLDARDAVVELLALQFTAGEDGQGEITFDFAGGGALRLDVESINGRLDDLTDPWAARLKPTHPDE
ncbi:MAG: DUF2948 family protein [Alphaproteobacteria bacterium]|nr:DUF2948 family protein [Alphaproteobacteria bacterium]